MPADQNTSFRAWTILNEQGDIWTQYIFGAPNLAAEYLVGKGVDKHTVAPVRVRLELIGEGEEAPHPYEALLEAANWFMIRASTIQSKFNLWGPADTAEAMKTAFKNLKAAIRSVKED